MERNFEDFKSIPIFFKLFVMPLYPQQICKAVDRTFTFWFYVQTTDREKTSDTKDT